MDECLLSLARKGTTATSSIRTRRSFLQVCWPMLLQLLSTMTTRIGMARYAPLHGQPCSSTPLEPFTSSCYLCGLSPSGEQITDQDRIFRRRAEPPQAPTCRKLGRCWRTCKGGMRLMMTEAPGAERKCLQYQGRLLRLSLQWTHVFLTPSLQHCRRSRLIPRSSSAVAEVCRLAACMTCPHCGWRCWQWCLSTRRASSSTRWP